MQNSFEFAVQIFLAWTKNNSGWLFDGLGTALVVAVIGAFIAFIRRGSRWIFQKIFPNKVKTEPTARRDFLDVSRPDTLARSLRSRIKSWVNRAVTTTTIIGRWTYWRALYLFPVLTYQVPEYETVEDEYVFEKLREALVFFDMRFQDAFPGLRRTTEFNRPEDIAHRLGVLLRAPLTAHSAQEGRTAAPLWWTRGPADLHIENWYRLKSDVFVLNRQELKITKLVVIPGRVYWQHFIYIESAALDPIWEPSPYMNDPKHQPFYEELALVGLKKFSRPEYDDGSYERRGRVKEIPGRPQLRLRYLTKANCLVVPSGSPVRAPKLEYVLQRWLDECLAGTSTTEQLSAWLLSLPRYR